MQIQTLMRYTSIRTTKIKNSDNTKCWQGYSESGSLIHFWWETAVS